MIIRWFTDPSKGSFTNDKFSSYYQYDTASKKFVRIRLELGRTRGSGKTKSMFSKERYVGFGDGSQRSKKPTRWSINKDGKLCYDGKPLKTSPEENLTTFDTSSRTFDKDTFIHRGNAVATKTYFPKDIEVKHLNLLANEVIITGKDFDLTKSAAKPEDLSKELKDKVCEILGKDDFSKIEDKDILAKLQSQAKAIKEKSIVSAKESLNSSLEDVDKMIKEIDEKIGSGEITPNEDFTKSFEAFQKSVKSAQDASKSTKDIKKAIKELAENRTKLKTAAKTLEKTHSEAAEEVIDQSKEAIETAQKESETWESIETQYDKIEKAENIKEYEKSFEPLEEEI